MNGIINLDKALDWTSNDAVAKIRHALPRGTKVGHGGTLDPQAQGVLPILVGRATRLFDALLEKDKAYTAVLQLGTATDTQDAAGTVIATSDVRATEDALRAVLPSFTGDIAQIPPVYSAIKVHGERLYDLARRDALEGIELGPRAVHVHELSLGRPLGGDAYELHVRCGRGVYIRTLCTDIALAVGTVGHMSALTRTRCGRLCVEDAVPIEEVVEAARAGDIDRLLWPMDAALEGMPRLEAEESRLLSIRNGAAQPRETLRGDVWVDGALARLYCGGRFCALVRMGEDAARISALLIESAGEARRDG